MLFHYRLQYQLSYVTLITEHFYSFTQLNSVSTVQYPLSASHHMIQSKYSCIQAGLFSTKLYKQQDIACHSFHSTNYLKGEISRRDFLQTVCIVYVDVIYKLEILQTN